MSRRSLGEGGSPELRATSHETMIELEKLAEAALAGTKKSGVKDALVSVSCGESVGVEIRKNTIYTADYSLDSGMRIRAIWRGGTGYASGNPRDAEEAYALGEKAAELARASQADKNFRGLPRPASAGGRLREGCDARLLKLTAPELVLACQRAVEEARQVDGDIDIVSGGAGRYYSESLLMTTTGVVAREKRTSAGMGVMAVLRRGEETGYFYEGRGGRRWGDLRWAGLGRFAARKARAYLGTKKLETRRVDLVLAPSSAQGVISSLCDAANAEDIQRNRNFLVGRLGKKVASRAITVSDEPFLTGAYGTGTYDGEGVPHKPMLVVKNGVLKSLFHNSYTAGKADCVSTGHASGLGMGISATNLVLKRGGLTRREMIKSIKEGIFIESGGLDPNFSSGDISATIDFGRRIQNGVLTYPIKNAVVGTTIFELLASVDAVSSDVQIEAGLPMPAIRCRKIMVAGGGDAASETL